MKIYLLIIVTLFFVCCAKNNENKIAEINTNQKGVNTNKSIPPPPGGSTNESGSTKTTPSKTTIDPNKTSFTATEIAAAFHANPNEAEKAYYSKKIKVTGKILKIAPSGDSLKFATEAPGNTGFEDWDVIANAFLGADIKKISAMKPGQQITVQCEVNFHNNMGIAMDYCDLQ